jgi:molybdopterin-guanine dinucleotide biosynthesis protein A
VTAGLVLAGGRSSRMGRDKARLEVGGATLLDRARALLRDAGAAPVIVAGRADAPGGVPDPEPGLGPAAAARHALARLAEQGAAAAWAVPVDMPLLTPGLLVRLREAGGPGAAFAAHPLPFYVRLDPAALAASSATSVRGLLAELGAAALEPSPEETARLVNVNTPDEFDRLAARIEG